jgi:RNA polymerase sigma-70 factor (ECF subfamily)
MKQVRLRVVSTAVSRAAVEIARAAHPDATFDDEAFMAFVSDKSGALPAHGGDLLLVYLWSVGSAGAERRLLEGPLKEVPVFVASVDRTPDFVSDVTQELFARLLGERRLLQYGGRGPLGGWLRRAAVNTAASYRRPGQREEATEAIDVSSDALVAAPELTFFKARYREAFREAFVAALQSLSARERTVLRLNALSNVSIDELGQMYQVHRATAARWVQRARELIVERVQATLIERLQLPEEELEELLVLMRSQLDVSIARYLDAAAKDAGDPSGG